MTLPPEAINEFKLLAKHKLGLELDDTQASEEAYQLISLYQLIQNSNDSKS